MTMITTTIRGALATVLLTSLLFALTGCSGTSQNDLGSGIPNTNTQALHVPVHDVQGIGSTLDLEVVDELNPDAKETFYNDLRRTSPSAEQELLQAHTLATGLVRDTVVLAAQHAASQHTLAETVVDRENFVATITKDLTAVLQREHPNAFRSFTVRWTGLNGSSSGTSNRPLAAATINTDVTVAPTPIPPAAIDAMAHLPVGAATASVLMVPSHGWSVVAQRVELRPLLTMNDLARLDAAPHPGADWTERNRMMTTRAQHERDEIVRREIAARTHAYSPTIVYIGSTFLMF